MLQLKNEHITRFGFPTQNHGAQYCVFDQEGLLQMAVDLEIARLDNQGFPVTQNFANNLYDYARQQQEIYNDSITKIGIPPFFASLFNLDKKAEVIKYCRDTIITEPELFFLIHNCNVIHFSHQSKFPQFIPEHLIILDSDREVMKKGNIKPLSKKLKPLFRERRNIHIHTFQKGKKWHCFYFSYEDIQSTDSNHWEHGPHIHYFNYLWNNYSLEQVWDLFIQRKTKMDNIHIKFIPFDFDRAAALLKKPKTTFDEHLSVVFPVESQISGNINAIPTPVAQIATRGMWEIHISIHKENQRY